MTLNQTMEEDDLLKCAGQFEGAVCGDDRYTLRLIEACLPRLKVISKWWTRVDSIDADARDIDEELGFAISDFQIQRMGE